MASKYDHLINIIFSAKGADITQEQIKKVFGELEKGEKTTGKSLRQMGDFEKALRRVAIVVPVWAAAKVAFQAILAPIQEVTKAFFELDTGLAKVMTVTRIATSEQKKFYGDLANAALTYYRTSSASMKDITESMYQIGTAGRSATEILHGFDSVLNLSIATFGSVVDAGRTMTGILNVFGDSLKEQITSTEKMRYIADLLTYTWTTQQIEMNEIATAIGYVGSAADSLNIDLKTLVGTIGFLNTGLLRGSKAGTSLLNAFLQIAANSDKLRTLGIVFDPRKPLDFLDVMTQLRAKFEESGKSLAATGDLFDVFGKRGGRAISQILDNWDGWIKSIKVADNTFQNFAERTKDIAEKTLPKAFAKFMKLTFLPEQIGKGTNPILDWLNEQNKQIEENQKNLKAYYELIGKGIALAPAVITQNIPPMPGFTTILSAKAENQVLAIREFFDLIGEAEINETLLKQTESISNNLGVAAERAKNLFDVSIELGDTWEQVGKGAADLIAPLLGMTKEEFIQSEYLKKIYEYRLKNRTIAEDELKIQGGLTSELRTKLEEQDRETKYSLMKIAGAREEIIIYSQLEDKINYLNKLAKESNKLRKDEGKELYKTVGIYDVIEGNWGKILNSGSLVLDKEKDILELEKMRANLQSILNKRFEDQKNLLIDLAEQYEMADAAEKSRIRRLAELQMMTGEEVRRAYENSAYDKNLILDYWSAFSDEARIAIGETLDLFKDLKSKLPSAELTGLITANIPSVEVERGVPLSKQVVQQAINVTNKAAENINISIETPSATPEEMAALVGNQIKDKLLLDENFQNAFSKKISPKV